MPSALSSACTPSPLRSLAVLPTALETALSIPAAPDGAAELAVAALASRKATPAVGGRFEHVGRPPRLVVAASPPTHAVVHLPSPLGIALAHAAPSPCVSSLVDEGLGSPPLLERLLSQAIIGLSGPRRPPRALCHLLPAPMQTTLQRWRPLVVSLPPTPQQ